MVETRLGRLSVHASVPPALAALVIIEADRREISLRDLRSSSRRHALRQARREITLLARARDFSFPAIGRALNRDHSTIINTHRRAIDDETGAEADRVGLCGLCQKAASDPTVRSCTLPDCPLADKEAA